MILVVVMDHQNDTPSIEDNSSKPSVIQTSKPDPVDVNKIANANNSARREHVCSVVNQMISEVSNLF